MVATWTAAETYEADIVGRARLLLGPVVYSIHVVGDSSEHIVRRRFSHFEQVDAHFRRRLPHLPKMPVKARVAKVLVRNFADDRQRALSVLLQAWLVADPSVTDPVLRRFLAVSAISADECMRNAISFDAGLLQAHVSRSESFSGLRQRRLPLPGFGAPSPRHLLESNAAESDRCERPRRVSFDGGSRSPRNRKDNSFRPNAVANDCAFHNAAVVIARDVARIFVGEPRVDSVRLRISELLRNYARQDPELGYTQGMCFAAAALCVRPKEDQPLDERFGQLMYGLRRLWSAGFPMVSEGMPLLEEWLWRCDPELCEHLDSLSLDLMMFVPGAWLSVFAKWLPLDALLDVVPFLGKHGLPAFLAITFIILLYHRLALLDRSSLDEALPYLHGLNTQPAPEHFFDMCELAVPYFQLRPPSKVLRRLPIRRRA